MERPQEEKVALYQGRGTDTHTHTPQVSNQTSDFISHDDTRHDSEPS